jgi:hypothetical protein
MDENIFMPFGMSDELKAYIDRVVEQKVKEALAVRSVAAASNGPAILPSLSTPELDSIWVSSEFTPEEYTPPETAGAPAVGFTQVPTPIMMPYNYVKAAPRFSFRKKVSLFVIGVVALALGIQLLGANGIIDFGKYSELTATIFGNIF